jgi:hypothetical protein
VRWRRAAGSSVCSRCGLGFAHHAGDDACGPDGYGSVRALCIVDVIFIPTVRGGGTVALSWTRDGDGGGGGHDLFI